MSKLKKSLICSMFSMLFCTSMFVGTTYAWFTDEVTVPTNKIVAGNLDVELYSKVNGEYKVVGEETKLFNENVRWEPGHVEVVNLKVANVGSLALEYSLGIRKVSETPGISVKTNESFNLSEYIHYAVIDEEETFANRDEALLAASRHTPRKLSEYNFEEGYELMPKDEAHPENISEHFVTMIVFMPTDVGNEANHKTGTPAPEIELGVNLSARQSSFENDSFDDKYDESVSMYGAQINNKMYSSITAALANAKDGETVKLLKNASVKKIAYTPTVPTAVTLDLNGYSLSTTATSYIGDYKTGIDLDFTIKNGTFNCSGTAIWPDAGTKLILDDVVLNAEGNYAITLPSLKNNPKGNVELVVNNSKVVGKGYAGIVNFGPYPVTIDNSTIEGKYFGLSHNGQAQAQAGTYNITGSTFKGTDAQGVGIYISNTYIENGLKHTFNLTNSTAIGATALEVKHTNATITGCTLIANAPELSAKANGNGPCTLGYSLAVTTNPTDNFVSGNVTVDETSTLIWKKGEVEEEGKVFVFNKDGSTTPVVIKGTAVSETMVYTPAA